MQSDKVRAAIERFRQANARDPNRIFVHGRSEPKELVQAERLARWVEKLEPNPSDALRLAAHCQHLCRWEIPRGDYPQGRIGYLKWRKALAKFHADTAGEILRELDLPEETILAVRAINLKQGLSSNPETQTIEDALCLSFLEHELADFADQHPAEKVTEILRKSWRKMSERGRQTALGLKFSRKVHALVQAALADAG